LHTSSFCCLISMDHKGSVSLLISFLTVNMLFHKSGSSYPTTKTPQRPIQQLHMIPLRDWIEKFRAWWVKVIYSILQYPLPKSLGPPTNASCTFSLGWNRLHIHHLKIPKVITHELPRNHSRNPWHNHPLPCVGPYRKNTKLLDLFLALSTMEI
jgi:hypothetical protein